MQTQQRKSGVSTALEALSMHSLIKPIIEKKQKTDLSIKVANTLEEREEVFKLAYKAYYQKKYVTFQENGRLIFKYDNQPETLVLVVRDSSQQIVGTATLVFDEFSKLPAENIYEEEIRSLKLSGKRSVELCRLVVHPEYRNAKDILVLLFNYAAIYICKVKHYDGLMIEVNPRHKAYYKSLLHFDEIGTEKQCPHVENAPSVLLYLPAETYYNEMEKIRSCKEVATRDRSLYSSFLKLEQEELVSQYLMKQASPMTMNEQIYFGLIESGFHEAVSL